MFLCEEQEGERWKATDTYTASTRYWQRDVTHHNLDTSQNRQCLIDNRSSTHLTLKTFLRWSHKLTKPKLIFKSGRIKAYFDAYVYNLLSFKPSSPFFNVCTGWLYTLSQRIAEQKRLGSHIIIHWRYYTVGFCRKLKPISKWGLGHSNPYRTLWHCWKIPCLNTLVGSVRNLIILLRYTLSYYSVEQQPALKHCVGILYPNTLLSYTQL